MNRTLAVLHRCCQSVSILFLTTLTPLPFILFLNLFPSFSPHLTPPPPPLHSPPSPCHPHHPHATTNTHYINTHHIRACPLHHSLHTCAPLMLSHAHPQLHSPTAAPTHSCTHPQLPSPTAALIRPLWEHC